MFFFFLVFLVISLLQTDWYLDFTEVVCVYTDTDFVFISMLIVVWWYGGTRHCGHGVHPQTVVVCVHTKHWTKQIATAATTNVSHRKCSIWFDNFFYYFETCFQYLIFQGTDIELHIIFFTLTIIILMRLHRGDHAKLQNVDVFNNNKIDLLPDSVCERKNLDIPWMEQLKLSNEN